MELLKSHVLKTFDKARPFIQRYFLSLLFIIGLCFGAGIKSLLNDVITIGYDDYKQNGVKNTLDLNVVESALIEKGDTTTGKELPYGEICSE